MMIDSDDLEKILERIFCQAAVGNMTDPDHQYVSSMIQSQAWTLRDACHDVFRDIKNGSFVFNNKKIPTPKKDTP